MRTPNGLALFSAFFLRVLWRVVSACATCCSITWDCKQRIFPQQTVTLRLCKRGRVFSGRLKCNFKVLFGGRLGWYNVGCTRYQFSCEMLVNLFPTKLWRNQLISFSCLVSAPEDAFQISDSLKDCLHDHVIDGGENLSVCLIGMCL